MTQADVARTYNVDATTIGSSSRALSWKPPPQRHSRTLSPSYVEQLELRDCVCLAISG